MFKVGWANLSCLPEHNPIVSWGKSIYVTMFCLMQFCGRQFLKWSISIPFAMASSQEWAGPSNEWSMTKVKRLGFKETMASILWYPLTLFCSEGSQLPYCNLLYRENVCPQPTASKYLKPVNSFTRDLRSISFPGKPSNDSDPANTLTAALWEVLSQKYSAQLHVGSCPTETVRQYMYVVSTCEVWAWFATREKLSNTGIKEVPCGMHRKSPKRKKHSHHMSCCSEGDCAGQSSTSCLGSLVKDTLGVLRTLTPSLVLHLIHACAVTPLGAPFKALWRWTCALTGMWEGLFWFSLKWCTEDATWGN